MNFIPEIRPRPPNLSNVIKSYLIKFISRLTNTFSKITQYTIKENKCLRKITLTYNAETHHFKRSL
jgi:hypothetical protein